PYALGNPRPINAPFTAMAVAGSGGAADGAPPPGGIIGPAGRGGAPGRPCMPAIGVGCGGCAPGLVAGACGDVGVGRSPSSCTAGVTRLAIAALNSSRLGTGV